MPLLHPSSPRIRKIIGAAAGLLLTALSHSAPAAPLADPIPTAIPDSPLAVDVETVADGLTAPVWGTAAPGHGDRLYVADQDGILWNVDLDSGSKSVLLNVNDRLVSLGVGGPGTFDERGLLGVAFHPQYQDTGLLYTYTSEPVAGSADFSTLPADTSANHQSVISEWQVPAPGSAGSVVDPATRREVLRIDQPQFNHNAGALSFGPDGDLFVSLGDGGAADDQGVGHVPGGNGQDPSNVLGTLLRIDPGGSDSANGQYSIPEDNPFADSAEGADEVYAYGFRNPYRFSFDPATGDLVAADVGQNDIEEVDLVTSGGNYGWREKEGTFLFDANGSDPGFVSADSPGSPAELTDPVLQYDHDEGIAVVGGFVYRGSGLGEALSGKYLFGDYFYPDEGGGRLLVGDLATGQIHELLGPGELDGISILGFGRDAAGELYVLGNETGTPFGDSGVVLKITREVPVPGTLALLGLGLAALGLFGRRRPPLRPFYPPPNPL